MEEFQHWARIISDVLGDEKHKGYASDWARLLVDFALKCDDHNLDLLTIAFPIPCITIWLWRKDEKKLDMLVSGDVPLPVQGILEAVSKRTLRRDVGVTRTAHGLAALFGAL